MTKWGPVTQALVLGGFFGLLGMGILAASLPEPVQAAGPANYWVHAIYIQGPNEQACPRATSYCVTLSGAILGSNVDGGGIERFEVQVPLLFADTPATIQTKVVDAVVAEGTRRGYTLQRNGGLIPGFQRGS